MLPDAVMNGMGWQPPPIDASLSGMPDDGSGYGLHPAVLQSLGIQPAPPPVVPISAAPVQPPPADTSPDVNLPPPVPAVPPGPGPGAQLPSAVGQSAAPAPAPHDFHVAPPVSPIAAGAPGKAPTIAPVKPQSVEQAMAANQAAMANANQEEKAASAASTQAQLGQAAGQLAAEQDYAAKEAELQKQAAAQRDEALKAHREAQQVVDDRMKALDNYKIDSSKYWNSMGMGDHIGWYIGIALSQIGNALMGKGGDNQVMQMLQDKMKQSIIMQQDQRDQMKEGVGRAKEAVQSPDLYQAKRAADIAAAQADATKMLKIQVDLATAKAADPQIRANGQMESAKLDRQLAQDQGVATEKLADYNIKKQNTAIAAGHLALANKQYEAEYGPQGFKQQELQLQAAKLMQAGKQQQAKELVSRGIGGLTVDGKAAAEDGSNVLLAPSEKEAEELRKQKAGVDTVNEFVNDMSRQIAANGGASKWLQSPDFQKMMAKKESLLFALHQAYGVAGFRPGVLEQMEKALGGTDPTSFFRSAEPGLKEARDSLNRTFTSQLRVMDPRFKGEYKPEDTSSPVTPAKTESAMAISDALKRPAEVLDESPGKRSLEFGDQSLPPTASPRERAAPHLGQLVAAGNVLPSVRQNIATWGAMLDVPDQAGRAEAILKKIADTSDSPETAALARSELDRRLSTNMLRSNASPEVVRGSSGLPVPQVSSTMPAP